MSSGDSHRLVLETSRRMLSSDYAFIILWIDETVLHAATNDYGDSADMGSGFDIPHAFNLLQWLVDDRFGGDWSRFAEFSSERGFSLLEDPGQSIPNQHVGGVQLVLDEIGAYAYLDDIEGKSKPHRISDWKSLLLVLIRDRCEGSGARQRLEDLLSAVGIQPIDNWRGYV